LSSFAVEVKELADILKLSTERSLVLGDEVCSGTESYSATSLVAATLEHLEAKGAHFMFATHLHDLLKVPGLLHLPGISVWHLRVIREEGKLIYDRTLQPGSGSATYGLEVARAMGLPIELMNRAYTIRRQLGGEVAADEAPSSSWNSAIKRQACEHCGSAVVRQLEVHHIEERAKGGGNHIRNLVVLCEKCHDKHHSKEIEILPLTQTSEGPERIDGTSHATFGERIDGTSHATFGERIDGTSHATFGERIDSVSHATFGERIDGTSHATFSEKLKIGTITAKKAKWTEDQIETIKATVSQLQGRPVQRIATELQETHGILITAPQLKKFLF
jgi:hypothetical protein